MHLLEWQTIYALLPWFALAVAAFILLFFFNAPYGRYSLKNTGMSINGGLAWLIMESPSPLIIASFFIFTNQTINITQLIFLIMWESHYVHRTFIYPFTMRSSRRLFPLLIVSFGFFFNVVNAYLNGNSILVHRALYTTAWLSDIRFIIGVSLFILGYIANRHSDWVLYKIRGKNHDGYSVPHGGLFRWVSCPNYLGEITLWIGWAIATWSLAGLAFAIWTVANLAPRAVAHHKWYRDNFEDYPENRHALIPGIW